MGNKSLGGIEFERLGHTIYIDRNYTPIDYDDAYFDHYEQLAATPMGQAISAFREGYVTAFAGEVPVLDYGCGYGTIVMRNPKWHGFDIMDKTKQKLGAKYRSDWQEFSVICFFDVLEHLSHPEEIMCNVKPGTLIFASLPLWGGPWNDQICSWRHWKPKEHYLYASPSGIKRLMDTWRFEILDHNQIETALGRNNVHTYCFRKR